MDSAISGLIGSGIGACAGLSVAFFSNVWQAKRENKHWLRSKRDEIYSNAIGSLNKFIHKRSAISANGVAYIQDQHIKEWFEDFSDIQKWVCQIKIYSKDKSFANDIDQSIKNLSDIFDNLLHGRMKIRMPAGVTVQRISKKEQNHFETETVSVIDAARRLLEVTTKSAQADLAK